MQDICVVGRKIPVHKHGTLIIGSGCAGFNAADTLYDLGVTDIAIVTEGVNLGTSRNTGSDKQTYYKMSVESGHPDSVDHMAQALFEGIGVHGDTAWIEAANSLRSFMKLVNLGVPFPTNEYGEFVSYRTDHDTGKRATSAGPLTSKYMTEVLERQVRLKNIPIFDHTMIVELLTETGRIVGAIGLNKQKLYAENMGFEIFLAEHVILATGGPASVYANSVYPRSQLGMTGLAIRAGAVCANLQEWQYGLASVDFRWNLSGTYQQVIPRYISVDEEGQEHEFLADYFENPAKAMSLVFMKGYQWPFDSAKLSGSSVIDLIVYHEEHELGRKVYLDYRTEPKELADGFSMLSEEAYQYLKNSDALISTPIARLAKMNPKAIALYRDHGIDLYQEPLRITVAAQHNNGGVAVNQNWESSISGLYVAGEAAGTFGVYRPGGSALNSTQVGSLRAAESIRDRMLTDKSCQDVSLDVAVHIISGFISALDARKNERTLHPTIAQLRRTFAEDMSAHGAVLRDIEALETLGKRIDAELSDIDSFCKAICPADLPAWFRLRDLFVTQKAVISSICYAGRFIGTRGGSVICESAPELTSAKKIQSIKITEDIGYRGKVLHYHQSEGCSFIDVREIPKPDNWFELVWNRYNERKGYAEKKKQ